ncbi:MAG: A/G-specific adenine glycosylase [Burkholderiaceae bacterium]
MTGLRFAHRVIDWQGREGRHDLPWQGTRDPYRIWLSEIMLQQTQVATVIPYYQRFIEAFPNLASLAAAPLDRVMQLWSGLGYYSRARNLHRCARELVERHDGVFPLDSQVLATLPGIGRSTAAAIAVFAAGERAAILDGNVRRVLCRVFGVTGWPGERSVEAALWALAERELPEREVEAYTQGLMDLGATVCTRHRPACDRCPLAGDCVAWREGRVAELPTPRPAREVPARACRMLAIRQADGWLVERRPPAGIWGGLWSLPQTEPVDGEPEGITELAARLGQRHGLVLSEPGLLAELPAFVHAFTHFRLRIEPWFCETLGARAVAAPGSLWLADDEIAGAALPRPVKRLLLAALRPPPGSPAHGA